MPDLAGPPQVSFAGGAASMRVETDQREEAQHIWFQLMSIDPPLPPPNVAPAGQTVGAAQISQATGYQLSAAVTWFSSTPAAGNGACVLPQTNRPYPFQGLLVYVINASPNPINCYAHPNDTNNSINSLAANAPVVLGANTITPFQGVMPGIWFADGIGAGQSGSLETIVAQAPITPGANAQGTATPITQAMVQVSSGSANQAVLLPMAVAGLQVVVNPLGSNTPLNVYPQPGQNINALGANAPYPVTLPAAAPTIFFCFVTGTWTTK